MDDNTNPTPAAPPVRSSLGRVSLRIREANCADCYRCVRYCTVKAIRVDNSHPYIMRKLCISCGSCLDVCLQKAVRVTSDLDYVRQLLQSGQPIALSLSPVCLVAREGGAAKLISDLLNDAKIPAADRAQVPVVHADVRGPVVWVAPVRTDERAKVVPATRALLELTLLDE